VLGRKDGTLFDLALHLGVASGRRYARSLYSPAAMIPKPRNPFWCPARNLVWRLGFALGTWDVLHQDSQE
jgi:hypothetical protein